MSTFVEPDWPHDPDRLGSVTVALEQADRARLDDVKKTYKDVLSALDSISKTFGGFAERSQQLLAAQHQPPLWLPPGAREGYASEAPTGVIPGQPSPGASMPGGPPGPPSGGGGGGAPPPGDPGDNASVAPGGPPIGRLQKLWNNAQGMSFAGPNLTSMERAQIRLGQFPSYGLSQALFTASWMAGTAGWNRLPEEEVRGLDKGELDAWGAANNTDVTNARQDEAGNWFNPHGGTMGTMARQGSVVLGALGQISMRGLPLINRARNFALNASITGSQAGFSTSGGWLGTPFMSPAFKHDIGMRIHAAEASWLGLNPNYSGAQAAEAQAVINASGYHGDDASMLAHMMQSMYQSNRFMSPDLVMQLMDPLLRTGGGNPQDLKDALGDLTDAAKNAHIGLQQFTQDLVSAATQVSSDTGMNIATAVTSLKAMTTVTRITPSALAPMLTSQNLLMGAAITGEHISDIMEGRGTARAAFALPSRMMRIMMGGMDFAQFQQLRKTDPVRAKNIYDQVYRAYLQNKQIFGGMNPRQVLNYMAHEHIGNAAGLSDRAALIRPGVAPELNMANRTQAMMDIGNNHALTISGMTHEIREFGGTGSKQVYRDFMADLAKHGGKLDKSDYSTIKRDLLANMDRFAGRASDKAARQVTIALEPQYARKLFKLLGAGSDPSTSNQHESFGHKALGVGEKALHIAEDTGRVVGDVMKYIP